MKKKTERVDGLGPDDIKKIRIALRRVWSWSYPRKLCLQRVYRKEDEMSVCESCGKIVPKVQPDHIIPCGDVDGGYINRLFVSSIGLQALCRKCHNTRTRAQRQKKA